MPLDLSTIQLQTYNLSRATEVVDMEDSPGERMLAQLTPREREVVGCIADGMPDKIICEHLGCSYQTVKRHLVNIRNKIGMTSRLEIAVAVYRHPSLLAAVPIPSLQAVPDVT